MGTTTLTMLGGEPAAIRSSAAQWRSFGVTAAAASVTVAAQSAVAVGFAGGEGEQYRIRLADFAAGLDTVGDAWCQVAAALEAFAGELEACQADLRTLARSVDEPADSPGGPADDLKAGQDQDDADREAAVRQRAQQIQERHRAAVRRCCVAINLARALAPNPTGTILGLRRVVPGLTTPPTTTIGTSRDPITAVSHRLRTAATTATQAGGLSLHRGAALSTPTDDSDPYADAPDALKPGGEVWKEIHQACVANTPDDQGSGISTDGLCIGVANSVAADPTSLPTVMQQYSGYFLGPSQRTNSWAVVGGVFADLGGMVADVTGISDCLDGDAIGCTIAAAGMVIGGPLGSSAGRVTKAGVEVIKGGDKAVTAARTGKSTTNAGKKAPSRSDETATAARADRLTFGSFSASDIRAAASMPDRNGLTRAGRGLQKHASRKGSAFARMSRGPSATRNGQGLQVVNDILDDPGAVVETFDNVTNIWDSTGRGIRLSNDGVFMGFLEPRR